MLRGMERVALVHEDAPYRKLMHGCHSALALCLCFLARYYELSERLCPNETD
jgi:hypothetical protein